MKCHLSSGITRYKVPEANSVLSLFTTFGGKCHKFHNIFLAPLNRLKNTVNTIANLLLPLVSSFKIIGPVLYDSKIYIQQQ